MLRRPFLVAAALVLPLALLLFAQWPLRELLHAWSREANDAAQVLFAVVMAAGVTWATRSGRHLVAGQAMRSGRVRAALLAVCVLPWCAFLLWTMTAPVWESLRSLEKFPETLHPGYFLVKLAGWCLVAGVLVQALKDAWRPERPDA